MTDAAATGRNRTAPDPRRNAVSRLKGAGYLTSTVSVLLLAAPSLKSALEQPVLFVFLLGGVIASIAGMALRWRSHRLDERRQNEP